MKIDNQDNLVPKKKAFEEILHLSKCNENLMKICFWVFDLGENKEGLNFEPFIFYKSKIIKKVRWETYKPKTVIEKEI